MCANTYVHVHVVGNLWHVQEQHSVYAALFHYFGKAFTDEDFQIYKEDVQET